MMISVNLVIEGGTKVERMVNLRIPTRQISFLSLWVVIAGILYVGFGQAVAEQKEVEVRCRGLDQGMLIIKYPRVSNYEKAYLDVHAWGPSQFGWLVIEDKTGMYGADVLIEFTNDYQEKLLLSEFQTPSFKVSELPDNITITFKVMEGIVGPVLNEATVDIKLTK